MAKRFTLVWAAILIGGALLYRAQGTPVVVIALAIASFTYGGLLGGFFLAMLWKRANQRDAITAMSVAIAVMAVVVFSGRLLGWAGGPGNAGALSWLEPLSKIAWPWYVLIGTSITMIVGILSSFTHAPPAVTAVQTNTA
jgi:solute:Na+ symporter, SSS family